MASSEKLSDTLLPIDTADRSKGVIVTSGEIYRREDVTVDGFHDSARKVP